MKGQQFRDDFARTNSVTVTISYGLEENVRPSFLSLENCRPLSDPRHRLWLILSNRIGCFANRRLSPATGAQIEEKI